MPEQNASVSKHKREWVQIVVSREIGIAKQGDEGRIFGLKASLCLRAQLGCGDTVYVEGTQDMPLGHIGTPRTVRTAQQNVGRMQCTERRDVTPPPVWVFRVDCLNRGYIVQPSGKFVG
jgi:hypothetical protein